MNEMNQTNQNQVIVSEADALEYFQINAEMNELKKRVEAKKEFIKKAMMDNGDTELKFANGVTLIINYKNTRDYVPDYNNPNADPLQTYLRATGHYDEVFKPTIVIDKDTITELVKTGKLDKNAMEAFKQITKSSAELRASKA